MYFRFVIVCHIHFPDRFFRGLFVPCFFSLTFPSAITIQFSRPFSSCALQLHMSHFVCVVLFAYFELQPHSHTKTTTTDRLQYSTLSGVEIYRYTRQYYGADRMVQIIFCIFARTHIWSTYIRIYLVSFLPCAQFVCCSVRCIFSPFLLLRLFIDQLIWTCFFLSICLYAILYC